MRPCAPTSVAEQALSMPCARLYRMGRWTWCWELEVHVSGASSWVTMTANSGYALTAAGAERRARRAARRYLRDRQRETERREVAL